MVYVDIYNVKRFSCLSFPVFTRRDNMVALIRVTVTVRAEHASGETVQLKTFHTEKEQQNAEQKTPSDASNTQVVVDAAAVIAVCYMQWLCVQCYARSARMIIHSSFQTCFCHLILFHSCPKTPL